jgi:hypothetical protein
MPIPALHGNRGACLVHGLSIHARRTPLPITIRGEGERQGDMAAEDCGEHCPFLNRSDRRCASFLKLDRLAHAFDHCFGEYKSCPMYLELLAERRVRRLCGLLAPAGEGSGQTDGAVEGRRNVVQLTVGQSQGAGCAAHDPTYNGPVGPYASRYPQHTAAAQGVPAAPRV